ncbi:translation initiation factor 3 (bIF-3) [Marinimicrobium koreense]|jgi:translation initiation factor IF-3|uniref:Translation initiation factor IF-3 n=1 Tax=Marinimicrobium koreense TaxID=306545 RepID=A0A3N1NJ50_9GAMM|nr:translation initiation factor IF-3 [Marinimicrobium sp.]ROQ19854.1 translation initiation factor 3 (bIF-3) [Marinimicrobium koreense]
MWPSADGVSPSNGRAQARSLQTDGPAQIFNKQEITAIKRPAPKGKSKKARINDQIEASEVRLIGPNGDQIGVVPLADALEAAQSADLDLVEISPDSDPIVCKVMDYGKHLFEIKKTKAAAKKKQKQQQIKEMKFRPGTEEGDYEVKLRNLVRFLENGDKAKVTLRFRGREMAHQELGMDVMHRIEQDLIELGTVEQKPKMEGRQLTMVIAPKKKK